MPWRPECCHCGWEYPTTHVSTLCVLRLHKCAGCW
jgi:hypothetical protein